ncbi:tRNA (adenosine(37)-N6)-dimethylallyltransferase MiaA [Rhizobium tumorigenes]|uniref:tRNA (adenosine(37)-N6)-dimethylallyltransferase MiaA n=1 Tax=Rhizobium tumorigenes TaxID=2041385 RepID=UPI00241FD980|nr:tRNA (adenosine(37)-N6)-dimethylallyltransferase MiaA [Rhizobium tumorigenes]WFS02820.1 tRNA (adenosine(37)-N6)-dimethylallyltransferase MiaA [Rhizobium tumorigenes]
MMGNLVNDIDAILITGPTASGKSGMAVELASLHDGVVINADSMQVYDTLRVLTARPSIEDTKGIPHHLYGHLPAGDAYSTGMWLRQISQLLAELRRERRMPVIVGGTGLYFKALTGGLSPMPEIPAELREGLRQRLIEEGAEPLYRELAQRDPAMAATLKPQDGQRIVRALEVKLATGQSLAALQGLAGPVIIDPARARKIVVLPERQVLHERIDRRFEAMLADGAEKEVADLLALGLSPQQPVMKAIGVSQIAAMLRGEIGREEVIELGSAATRQYAKRQMTWFRNQMDQSWERIG